MMKSENMCVITEELLREMGYRFPDRNTLELFLTFVNAEFRERVAADLIGSLTDAQQDTLSTGCAADAAMLPQLLSMIRSPRDLPQVEAVVMRSWRSFREELRSQKEQVMARFGKPCTDSHSDQRIKALNPIIPAEY